MKALPKFIEDSTLCKMLTSESYLKNWNAFLIDVDGKKRRLHIHRGGPDFMYVHLPNDAKYPIQVVFKYGKTLEQWFGYTTSLVTLIVLLARARRVKYLK